MSSSGDGPLTPVTSVDSMKSHADKVVPTADQSNPVFNFSKALWQGLATAARSMSFSRNTVKLASLAKYGPKLPDDMEATTELKGVANWSIAKEPAAKPGYNVTHGPRQGLRRRWHLMKFKPTACEISERNSFNFSDSESNGLVFMFLAWSYIISVFLLEQQKIPVVYEEAAGAPGGETPTGSEFMVDLGDASEEETHWWTAILSPGQGWKADHSSQPVWAIAYTGNVKFYVMNQGTSSQATDVIKPPTSKEALSYLARFASMYNLEGQAALGLAMALTIPLHDNMSSTIQVPEPSLVKTNIVSHTATIEKDYRNLSYYIVLSSNPAFFASALWSVFWEPEIDCNLASAWCDPIIDVIQPLINGEDFETLGHVLALRRPEVAAMWYGLVACGTTETILAIVPYLETLHTPVPAKLMPEVAAWTNTPQSFMDLTGSGPYLQDNHISRADLWRLRHEYWNAWRDGVHFRHLPTTPFRPFGHTDAGEVEVAVRAHLECSRHEWVYTGFTWNLDNGVDLTHEPCTLPTSWAQFEADSHLHLPRSSAEQPAYELDFTASRTAVGDMFRWAATEMDTAGKHIYAHAWVDVESHFALVEQESNRGPQGMMRLSELSMERVKEWVANHGE